MDTAELDIEHLAARCHEDPTSPSFARLAELLLERSRIHEALALCEKGVTLHPTYASAQIVLGRCYEVLGRISEARSAYHRALELSPFNTFVQRLLVALPDVPGGRLDTLIASREHTADLLPQPEERAEAVVEPAAPEEEPAYDPFPTFEEYVQLHPAPSGPVMTLDDYLKGRSPFPLEAAGGSARPAAPAAEEPSTDLESLAQQLQQAKRIVPTLAPGAPAIPEEAAAESAQPTIVTQTMAEIYVAQHEFRAAIDAYKELITKQPEHAKAFQQRIDAIALLIGNDT